MPDEKNDSKAIPKVNGKKIGSFNLWESLMFICRPFQEEITSDSDL